jgi:hypothetical protein
MYFIRHVIQEYEAETREVQVSGVTRHRQIDIEGYNLA